MPQNWESELLKKFRRLLQMNIDNEDANKRLSNDIRMGGGYENDDGGVKVHHILVLLLRLRQICCHPTLIKEIVTENEKSINGIDGEDDDLIAGLSNMSLSEKHLPSANRNNDSVEEVLDLKNPVFHASHVSSKMKKVLEIIDEIRETNDKAVVVSQWTSMLDIVAVHLKERKLRYLEITGKVKLADRDNAVNDFNNNSNGAKILLLSLATGGVGLNLVGGNHLIMLDLHWNPQLENQACDRIYRFGQKKEVHIHKFVCEATVERVLQLLQAKKLKLAQDILTGAVKGKGTANKLTFEDLMMLFGITDKQKPS